MIYDPTQEIKTCKGCEVVFQMARIQAWYMGGKKYTIQCPLCGKVHGFEVAGDIKNESHSDNEDDV